MENYNILPDKQKYEIEYYLYKYITIMIEELNFRLIYDADILKQELQNKIFNEQIYASLCFWVEGISIVDITYPE